jgi:hypothetical protein
MLKLNCNKFLNICDDLIFGKGLVMDRISIIATDNNAIIAVKKVKNKKVKAYAIDPDHIEWLKKKNSN